MKGPEDVCGMCRNFRLDHNGRCAHCDLNAHAVNSYCTSCINGRGWDGTGPTGEPGIRKDRT